MSVDLSGRRVLVVGASDGIGKEFAEHAIRAGASVVLAARRLDALTEITSRLGGGTAVAADVTDDASIDALVSASVAALGQIDLVMYAAGATSLTQIRDVDTDSWNRTLAINVVGFNQLARRVIGAMAPGGIVVALSSETAVVPRDGMVAYAASKAALDVSVRGWHTEHPEVRWSCVAVGATFPTGFGNSFDPDLTGALMDQWIKRGLLQESFMVPGEVAQHLLATYASALDLPSVNVEHITIRSPSATIGTVT
ncbi:MAG: short-chain dehydrogenase [Ilumatobacteraceae bacterium]|nr:short-chain dehydrogenase [Ilumatobacteraceae bacterium]